MFNTEVTNFSNATFDSSANKVVIAYRTLAGYGTGIVFENEFQNLTAENYIGISNDSYSDGETAQVQIVGAVDDAQTGLTAGQSYYVQIDGSLSTSADTPSVFAGTAISATKLIVKG